MRHEAIVPVSIAVTVLCGFGYVLSTPQAGNLQLVVSILMLLLYLGATLLRPTLGLALVSATIPFLGVFRRILYQQSPTSFDALLLVIPLYSALMLLVIVITHRERFRAMLRQSLTSRLLLILMFILAAQIFNPLQGGLAVGVAGALFYLVPLCWYFIGRLYLTDAAMKTILTCFVISSVIAAAYGLMQTLVGFPGYDAYWIAQVSKTGYVALNVGSAIRAFGPATSAAEYASFLSAGLACLFALIVFRFQFLAVIPIALLGTALILESSRTIIFLMAVILVALLALRQRSKTRALLMVGLLIVVSVFAYQQFSRTTFTSASDASLPVNGLLAHQINGLAHPLDSKYSTGQLHFQQIVNSFTASARNPFGFGLGSTTIAASKFGTSGQSAELDIPNMFLSGGIVAGVLYLIILYRTFRAGATLAFRYKQPVDVLAFVAVAITFGQTLNGGYYSLMPFVWMFIAWIDRRAVESLIPARSAPRRPPKISFAPPTLASAAPRKIGL